jgi:hypothetical protein
MRKQVFIYSLLTIFVSIAYAQTDADALRYSTPSVQGTARNVALGNTMGTIGAEISSLSTNPAGIAKFSSTEFSLSPAISIHRSKSTYLGNTISDGKIKFQITNVGFVIAKRYTTSSEKKKWNGLKFGFALNRLADFNEEYTFSSFNENNSLLTSYGDLLKDRSIIQSENDAETKYPFGASIAYQLGLITSDSIGNIYTAADSAGLKQDFSIKKSGGINEVAIGVASTYNDKIMFGASVGIPFVNYTERVKLIESDSKNLVDDLNNFSNETYLKTSGVGFNVKVGIIAMPVKNLRLSLAIQTPGILFMKDAYQTHMEVDYASLSELLTGDSPDGASKYKYVQPWKLTAGAGYIHKYGLVSVEYELSDASNSKFMFNNSDVNDKVYENTVNNSIKAKYGLFHTIKGGVEFKFDPVRIRGGIQYRTSPFKSAAAPTEFSTAALTYSAGLGYRGKHFFADIAYVQTNFKQMFVPYSTNNSDTPTANLSSKKPAIILTLGYKL